jgi:hypothetical protein
MRRKIVSILVTAATAVTALLVVAAPAQADEQHSCFGYTGNFKSGTRIERTDWNNDTVVDECFGIAPARTIWHAWPGSGGWKQMPNNGRADNVVGSFRAIVDQNWARHVVVRVTGGADYYSRLWENSGSGWGAWTRCTASDC